MTMTETSTPAEDTTHSGRPSSAPIVAALEATWTAIQTDHPEVPDVVIVLASGSVGMPKGVLRLGHFAAMRWHHTRGEARLPEVFVGGEGLARGAVDVLGTLLHEAAHALAHVRGIQDCSRQGRYHNRRFQALSTELGLILETGARDRVVTDPRPGRDRRRLHRADRPARRRPGRAPLRRGQPRSPPAPPPTAARATTTRTTMSSRPSPPTPHAAPARAGSPSPAPFWPSAPSPAPSAGNRSPATPDPVGFAGPVDGTPPTAPPTSPSSRQDQQSDGHFAISPGTPSGGATRRSAQMKRSCANRVLC